VEDLLSEWIQVVPVMVRQILANVQSYVWPHMGNAQRFYEGLGTVPRNLCFDGLAHGVGHLTGRPSHVTIRLHVTE